MFQLSSSFLGFLALSLVVAVPLSNFKFYDCQTITDRARVNSVDFNRYLGNWYELYRSRDFYFDHGCQCTTANYTLNGDKTIRVDNKCLRANKTVENIGRATIVGNASLSVQFTAPFHAPYDIVYISDDYTYAAVLSCSNVPFFGGLNLWLLGRSPLAAYNVEQIDDVFQRLRSVGLGEQINDLVETNQTHCLRKDMPITDGYVAKDTYADDFHITNVTHFNLSRYFSEYHVVAEIPDLVEHYFTQKCECIMTSIRKDMSTVQSCFEKEHWTNDSYSIEHFNGHLEAISPDYTRRGMFIQRSNVLRMIHDSYQVVDITDDYRYALVTNNFEGSLCVYFISREKTIPDDIFERFIRVAEDLEIYDITRIRYVNTGC